MKKFSNRCISLILSLLMLCTSIPAYAFPVYAEETENAVLKILEVEHGTVTVDNEDVTGKTITVAVGDSVTYQIAAESGYTIDYVTTSYDDGTSKKVPVSKSEYSNTVIVDQPTNIAVSIVADKNSDSKATEDKKDEGTTVEKATPTPEPTPTEPPSGSEAKKEATKDTAKEQAVKEDNTENNADVTENEAVKGEQFADEAFYPEGEEDVPDSDNAEIWGYLDPNTSEISTYSFDDYGPYVIKNERFDDFGGVLRIGLKYVVGDNENVDSRGQWRNVYCLNYSKDCPDGKGSFSYKGKWTNRKVEYAFYWGSVYYGQCCRWSAYSTGNWKLDYFVTQWAIHILNGEVSLATVNNWINNSSNTSGAKSITVDRLTKMVNDANNGNMYGGLFDSEGWIDMTHGATFSLSGNNNPGWYEGSDGYMYSNATYSCNFKTYSATNDGFDFREQITSYDISAPGAEVYKLDKRTYADFQIRIPKSTYASYQTTGKTINVSVTLKIPKRWGCAIYDPPASNYQKVCMLNWYDQEGTFTQNKTLTIEQAGGKIQINKRSANTSVTNGNGEYSLQGAVFDIYSGNTVVDTLTTDANGNATSKTLSYGSYTIKERTASKGYNKAADVTVNHKNSVSSVTINEPPKTGTINLQKKAKTDTYSGFESYTLKGAEYTIYNAAGKSVGTIVTDANGKGSKSGLPLGKYTVKETKAPDGYYISTTVDAANFNSNTLSVDITSIEEPGTFVTEDKVFLEKVDAETLTATAQGAGSLKNAEYTVKYYDVISDHDPSKDAKTPKYTWVFKTDEKGQIKLDDSHLVSGTLLKDSSGHVILPVGTLTIQESKAPVGYNLSSTLYVANTYVINGSTVIKGLPTGENAAKEVPSRGDVQFAKTNERNRPMGNIPFKLTSKTTGESHVIYSDADGLIRTAVRDNSNPNVDKNGVWFGEGKASKSKGALLFDTYLVEEQPCEENKGYILDSFEVTISKDGAVVNADTVRNLPELKKIIVTKKIKAADINFANGNPVFTFKCTGTDYEGAKHTYYQMVEITQADVSSAEYVSVSCEFKDLKMGDYVVTEEKASRYKIEKVTAEGGTVSGEKVTFDMTPANDTYTATYVNKKFEWQYFTDKTMKTNSIKVKK